MAPLNKLDGNTVIPMALVISALGFTATGTWVVTSKLEQLAYQVQALTIAVDRLNDTSWTYGDMSNWVRIAKMSVPSLPEPVQVTR